MFISEDRTTSRLPVKPDHFLHQYRVHTVRIGGGVFPQCRFRVKVLVKNILSYPKEYLVVGFSTFGGSSRLRQKDAVEQLLGFLLVLTDVCIWRAFQIPQDAQ